MKNTLKLFKVSLIIFAIVTLSMMCLYFLLHRFAAVYNLKYFTDVITQVGIIAAIIPTLIFILIYYLLNTKFNKLLLTFLIFILFILLLFSIYVITLNMVFYHLNDSKSFYYSLIESFQY